MSFSSTPDDPGIVSILYVDHARALGGAEHSLLEILRNLTRKKFRPVLACQSGRLAEVAGAAGMEVIEMSMPALRGCKLAPIRLIRVSLALARLVRRARIDIIHSNTMRASFYAAGASFLTGTPLVWHVRDFFEESWYPRLFCRISAEVVAVSKAVAKRLPASCRTTVIYNGLDPNTIRSPLRMDEFRNALAISSESPLIGCVGRLRSWKGQDFFLKAAPVVLERFPESRFLVVGGTIFPPPTDFEQKLRTLTEELGIVDSVLFLGHRQDVAAVMANLDLLVHTSRQEPFGRVLIEAMSMAVPVVALEGGAVEEVVVDGETGIVVPRDDVKKLGEAVTYLIENKELREEMGWRSRERVLQMFDSNLLVRQLEERYIALMEERNAHRI